MPTVRAVVHIGPMKTGTTAFAAAATAAQRASTLPAELLYPMGSLWFGDERAVVKHHQLNRGARRVPTGRRRRMREDAELAQVEAEVEKCVSEARGRAERNGSSTVSIVFVAEGLSHQPVPPRLTEVLLRHVDRVDYVMVARVQSRAIGSIIAHGVKDIRMLDRRNLDPKRYLSGPARVRRFDYASIIDRWRHDGAALHVIPFEESAPGSTRLIDVIAESLAIPAFPVDGEMAAKRTHPTYSAAGLRELARIKLRRHLLAWVPGEDDLYRRRFVEAWERHHRQARDGEVAPWRLPSRDAQLVVAAYAESNARFRDLLGAQADTPVWRDWFALALGERRDAGADPAPHPHPCCHP